MLDPDPDEMNADPQPWVEENGTPGVRCSRVSQRSLDDSTRTGSTLSASSKSKLSQGKTKTFEKQFHL
jgi:hypothetical protein